MSAIQDAVALVLKRQRNSGKPLGVILAGHNGAGKSTMWYCHLASTFQIPLINADRMMLSILPETRDGTNLPRWAIRVRDEDPTWMQVAQKGVEAFVAQAMSQKTAFAMETVFSFWQIQGDGSVKSKIENNELPRRKQRGIRTKPTDNQRVAFCILFSDS